MRAAIESGQTKDTSGGLFLPDHAHADAIAYQRPAGRALLPPAPAPLPSAG